MIREKEIRTRGFMFLPQKIREILPHAHSFRKNSQKKSSDGSDRHLDKYHCPKNKVIH